MKQKKTKIRWIICQKRKGIATKDIARDMKGPTRRVQQILKEYREMGAFVCTGSDIRPLECLLFIVFPAFPGGYHLTKSSCWGSDTASLKTHLKICP